MKKDKQMIIKQNEAFKLVHDACKKDVVPPNNTPIVDVKIM
jgi:hypothetical protein